MTNKYQWADVISNDENVNDVEVIQNNINVIYNRKNVGDDDLSWVGEFLEEKDYEISTSKKIGRTHMVRDSYVLQENNENS